MSYPTFICIGCQRAGTTTLHRLLRGHKEVWLPPIKELHHFDEPPYSDAKRKDKLARVQMRTKRTFAQRAKDATVWRDPHDDGRLVDPRDFAFLERRTRIIESGDRGLQSYLEHFDTGDDAVTGDITPAYSTLPERRVEWLAEQLPDTRIILILREPISRLWSAACRASATDTEKFRAFYDRPGIRARSFPSVIYETWHKHFGSRMQYVFFDDLKDRPELFFGAVCEFLGIASSPASTSVPIGHNSKRQPSQPIPEELKRHALDYFGDEHERCAELFGGPALAWQRSINAIRATHKCS